MRDGQYEFYAIEFKVTHKSEWLKPKSDLKPFSDHDWSEVGQDHFGGSISPWVGKNNDAKPKYRKAHDQLLLINNQTGHAGWFDLRYATDALKRLIKDDANGKYDYFGPYREHCQAVRREFRIVKISIQKSTEVLGSVKNPLMRELVA